MDERSAKRTGYPLTIPDVLLDSDAMRQACATRNYGEIFRLVNRRTGSSYADIATAVGKMTTSRVGDIIRGVRGVRGQGVIERICDGFGIPGSMLGVPEQKWERSAPSMFNVRSSETMRGTRTSERQDSASQNVSALDLVAVAELRQQVQELDSQYSTEPSTALIAETGRHWGQLAHWRNETTKYIVRRDLYAAVAETSTLMGQLVWDASGRTDHKTARSYFTQAAEAARELADPVSEGSAILRTSFVALYGEKNPSVGLTLTQQAADTVKTASHALSGLAVLHAAEAHAMLQQRGECEAALSNAEKHFGSISGNDAGISMLSAGQFSRLVGSCYLSLNDTGRAQVFLEDTIDEVREGSKSHAIALGNLALALVRQRRPGEAVHVLNRAIDIVESHRGGGGLNLIFQAGRELQSWRDASAVRNLNDRLFNVISSA